MGGAAAPGVRPGRVSVPALRRPLADRGGAHRGRELAWGARAARAREHVALHGRVALAAAREGVIAPAPRDRIPWARRLRTSRRPLPTASVLALVAPGLPSHRGQGARRLAALLSAAEGHRPCRALDFDLRGRGRGARQGERGKVGGGERAFGILTHFRKAPTVIAACALRPRRTRGAGDRGRGRGRA